MEDIKEYTLLELKKVIEKKGYPSFYAQQIFGWIYKQRQEEFELMTNISKEARRWFKKTFYFSRLNLVKREVSCDGTTKFIFELSDGEKIETVLIPEGRRQTLCLSTQVGCKFRCRFCVSGLNGWVRDLTTSEIVNQYLEVERVIKPVKVTNIVFMGIGEPLDNFNNVVKSILILSEPYGIYLGKRRICISTIGLIPQIERLRKANLGVKLSLSLHAGDNQTREKIISVSKRYPLDELMKVVRRFSWEDKHPLTFEYLMIRGLNSKREDALKLVRLVKNINCKINLIPYNSSPYFNWQPPLEEEIQEFKDVLKKHNVFFTLRKPRGRDINAACGQLRAYFLKRDK